MAHRLSNGEIENHVAQLDLVTTMAATIELTRNVQIGQYRLRDTNPQTISERMTNVASAPMNEYPRMKVDPKTYALYRAYEVEPPATEADQVDLRMTTLVGAHPH